MLDKKKKDSAKKVRRAISPYLNHKKGRFLEKKAYGVDQNCFVAVSYEPFHREKEYGWHIKELSILTQKTQK